MRKIPAKTLSALLCLLMLSGCSGTGQKPSQRQAYQPDFRRGMYVYNVHCGECHNTGRHDAPTLQDPEEWDLHGLGVPVVWRDHAAKGFLGGPGQNVRGRLTEGDLADVLHYMARRIADEEERY